MNMDRHDNKPFGGSYNRRKFIRDVGALSCAGLAATGFPGILRAQPGSGKRPNIIFILSDDHRWDHLSILGHPFIQTPQLDRMARRGVLFENAFVTTSLCSPSRATFLTGLYAHTHGVKNNLTPWNNDNVTFLEMLKSVGYDTAFIGKWHMPGRLPELRGVDHFVTFTVQEGQGRYFHCPLIVDGKPEPSRKSYITEELTDRSLEFMEKDRDGPFCLFLAHKAAHHQFLPPPEYAGIYDDVKLELPPEVDPYITMTNGNLFYGTMGPLSLHYRNYCETVTAMDAQIGRILDKVEEMGIADDTVIIYAGDNGFFWGEHRLVDKRWPYEESIRVPYIVQYPRMVRQPGVRAPQMITNVDLAPTVLEMAGLKPPAYMEGLSHGEILLDPSTPGRDAWLYEYFRDYPYNVPAHFAVRTRTHKYIEYQTGRGPELYDLVRDPREKNNLIGTPEGEKLRPRLKSMLEDLKPKNI